MQPIKLSSEKVYQSRTFALYREIFQKDDRQISVDIVRHRGAVGILPIQDKEVILERQFRYSLNAWILEIPAGTLEEGESDEGCARRELAEETGYSVDKLVKIGQIAATPGYDDEIIRLFVAWVSEKPATQHLDQDEVINVVKVRGEELLEKIKRGEVFDGKTVVASLLAKELGYL
ncbi:NUDIX hydrolase [Tardisphaera saccharovorans]|nr:NUDIX hydrolase [TACK group archaeon]